MIISVTGTPGAGKSTVSKILAKKLNANLIDIRELIESKKIPFTWDKKRNTRIVSTIHLKKAVEKCLIRNKINIVEGHLSHFMKSDFIFILRCNPKELEKRLATRNWKNEKIRENIHAEILDEITIETMESKKSRNIYEIDTSKKKPEKTASLIERILKYSSSKKYSSARRTEGAECARLLAKYKPGAVDWTQRYKNFLIRRQRDERWRE